MAALITVLSVLVLFFAVFLLFQTRKIEVTGNQYCQDEELVKWVQKDKYAFNSIYIWWKYNYGDVTKPAAIESVKVSIKNPWTVVMKVKEKEFLGYFDYQGEFLYFDEDGRTAVQPETWLLILYLHFSKNRTMFPITYGPPQMIMILN